MMRRTCILALVLVAPAFAKDRVSDVALEPLAACHAITDAAARLGCYDATVEQLQRSVGNRKVVAVDKAVSTAAVEKVKAGPADRDGDDRDRFINSTVASAVSYGNDEWGVRLADGSRWRTTQAGLGKMPQIGAEARIRPGAIGGFILQIGRGAKVHVMPEKKRS